ncbi:MAG: glycosyltransferase [Magnetococcales bacterium]|nr:glycosyltransferase [Magnetococcales bacterium]
MTLPTLIPAPDLSVLMSVHDGEAFLSDAIASIHRQTWTDFEFILIDDASTDATSRIINAWAARDSRIRPVTNECNLGLTRSLNKGIALARGRWIARLDADDIALPDRLERQRSFLDRHPDIGILGSAALVVNPGNDPPETCQINPATHEEICWQLLLVNPFFHSTVMFERAIALRHPYDETLRFSQDFELWGRLLRVTRGANLEDPLVRLGRHENRVSVRHARLQSDIGQGIIERRLAALSPGFHRDGATLRIMRQIMQTDWPIPNETNAAWSGLFTLFAAFRDNQVHDPSLLAPLGQRLVKRFLLSLFSSGGVPPSPMLIAQILTDFPRDTMEILFKEIRKRVFSTRKSAT